MAGYILFKSKKKKQMYDYLWYYMYVAENSKFSGHATVGYLGVWNDRLKVTHSDAPAIVMCPELKEFFVVYNSWEHPSRACFRTGEVLWYMKRITKSRPNYKGYVSNKLLIDGRWIFRKVRVATLGHLLAKKTDIPTVVKKLVNDGWIDITPIVVPAFGEKRVPNSSIMRFELACELGIVFQHHISDRYAVAAQMHPLKVSDDIIKEGNAKLYTNWAWFCLKCEAYDVEVPEPLRELYATYRKHLPHIDILEEGIKAVRWWKEQISFALENIDFLDSQDAGFVKKEAQALGISV